MRIALVIVCFLPLLSTAQYGRSKAKFSSSKGILTGYWGYNRSWYSKSAINFVGPGYDFTLKQSRATDQPTSFSGKNYFTKKTLLEPQFSAGIGYYFRSNWAVSFSVDRFKYIYSDSNDVLLSGVLNPGIDNANGWSGTYNSDEIVTNQSTFRYENKGLNYFRIQATRTDQVYSVGKKDKFAVSTNFGVGLGALVSNNTFLFGGKKDEETVSMSGIAFSGSAGLRTEFFRKFFFQINFTCGYMNQSNVNTRRSETNAVAKQKFAYTALDAGIGFILNVFPANDCNSCPSW
ncbi:MAG: hypothetical protein RJA13_121 [Bacteroidota bacterium]|jgi:hypothetical protein